ncbi:RHS domain-containing protein [Burkholderia sp. AU30280]|uniref:RHS domain-containing protein n=1 Tax=Burkholderia sp. AU30280 TaxID=2879628 RepID=UPI001CF4EAD4|nr:RHS domain-containing protein [Burkholderia sp. AU30280]MCA8277903.1 RHS domain-containing protein [Burkholderia sp. AU30280]
MVDSCRCRPRHGTRQLFYQNDNLGTPQELLDDSGKVVWLARYKAWGGRKENWWEQRDSAEALTPIRCVKEVFPQDPDTNRGAFRDFEGQIADQVARGDNVIVRVVPQYGASSTRPDSILYQVRTNGVTESRTFANPCPCKCP